MTGLNYLPQLAYVSGGGAAARSFAEGLVTMYVIMFAVWIIGRAAWKAHKRGLARVRRFNERHTPKHARRVK